MINIVFSRCVLVALTVFLLVKDGCGQAESIRYRDVISSNLRRGVRNHRYFRYRTLQSKSSSNVTVQLFLYNTVTDKRIATISNGDVINIKALGLDSPTLLNIEAVIIGNVTIGSVQFLLNNGTFTKIETGAPYAMCGNSGSDFLTCFDLKLGKQKVQAIPYSLANAKGSILTNDNTVNFEIVSADIAVPPNNSSCTIPKLVGPWENWERYPMTLGESAGALVGNDIVIVSGYTKDFETTTKSVYAFDMTNATAKWRAMDDVPVPGFTHTAYAVNGMLMYICGGYVGPTPGPHTPTCLLYNHSSPPKSQWSFLPPLPEGRGGGGLWFMNQTNSLLFALGATRPNGLPFDKRDTWELNLNNLTAGWIKRADVPYQANHVSHVTVRYNGKERHFALGGQKGVNEGYGNVADNFEWDTTKKLWVRRANMLFPRGHATSSTIEYGCGFLMAGGAINGVPGGPPVHTQTSDISYYSADNDKWTKLGDFPEALNTPICSIVRFPKGIDYLYCQTGRVAKYFNWRIKISF